MEFDKVIRERFSCRKFDGRRVSKDNLVKILEAGRLAPTAKNMQPEVIYVIEKELDKVDEVTPCRYGASTCLLVCSNKDIAWSSEDYSSYEMDASIVATHMILKATDLGLNSIWVRRFEREDVWRVFDIPKNIVPICFIFVGYIDKDGKMNPLHEVRKNIDDIVIYR